MSSEEVSMIPIPLDILENGKFNSERLNSNELFAQDVTNITVEHDTNQSQTQKKSYLWGIVHYIIFENFISKKLSNYFTW